jgi:hypothetical protein
LKVAPLNEAKEKKEEELEETEERWLQHYMLGKVAEKSRAEFDVFLKHYMKVC